MLEIIKLFLGKIQKLFKCLMLRKKIAHIYNGLKHSGIYLWQPDNIIKSNHRKLWVKYINSVDLKWLKVYGSISGIHDYKYVPEDIYYTELEPRLNNKAFSKAFTDKNQYYSFIDPAILPEAIMHSINGVYYWPSLSHSNEIPDFVKLCNNFKVGRYIIKPTLDTGGGEGIRIFNISDSEFSVVPKIDGINSLLDLIHYYGRNFIIQKYIEQHSFFEQFNHSSLNTIRIFTYRSLSDERINILHRTLRMGRAGSIVDNQAAGGIACGINSEGILSEFGVDKSGNKYLHSNGVEFKSIGLIPFLDEINELAINIAHKYNFSRLLGMDFAVNKDNKILLIEVNDSNNEINFYQMNNGPLFGIYTNEVAELSIIEPKSFVIDFNL